MKFVVTYPYGNEVDVKLHRETKDKIKKFAWYSICVVNAAYWTKVYLDEKKTDSE